MIYSLINYVKVFSHRPERSDAKNALCSVNVSFVVVNRRPPTWIWIGASAASTGRLANGLMGSCVSLESDASAMMAAG